ncbi:FAD-dependent oxidoreductase [candidate division KSB1 bacterium]|nr:FAD-dependent oxidoreductase [candidate division KSB1 bacterium]
MKTVLIIGSGAGGSTIANELASDFEVTVLEAGKPFTPFKGNFALLEKLRYSRLMRDERMIQWLFPAMKVRKTLQNMVLVTGSATGGSTVLSTGTALRNDTALRAIGLDLDEEFAELDAEIPVTVQHEKLWSPMTKACFKVCADLELFPAPLGKMGNFNNCKKCGHCLLGCPHDIKWDSRQILQRALQKNARLITNARVENLIRQGNTITAVKARVGRKKKIYKSDIVILSAGGLDTPLLLQSAGVNCPSTLSVDPVYCQAALIENSNQHRGLCMPFSIRRQGYMIAPYFDTLSFFFNKKWLHSSNHIFSLMIKLADENSGKIDKKGVDKGLGTIDKKYLGEAKELCRDILKTMGAKEVFDGTLNAGHPAGMLPLLPEHIEDMHHPALPENCYVADATLLPRSLGSPTILTIMAVAKRVARKIKDIK